MKKKQNLLLIIVLMAVFAFFMAGCGSGEPEEVPEGNVSLSERVIMIKDGKGLKINKFDVLNIIQSSTFPWEDYSQIYVGELSDGNAAELSDVLKEYKDLGVNLVTDAFRFTSGETVLFALPSEQDMATTGWSATPTDQAQKVLLAIILQEDFHIPIAEKWPGCCQ